MRERFRGMLNQEQYAPQRFIPTAVRIRGGSATTQLAIRNKLALESRISFETQQQDEALKEDALMSLFVIEPEQTGFDAVAEATAAAIRNPEETTILSLVKPEETMDEKIERESVNSLLAETGVPVFSNIDEAAGHINSIAGLEEADQQPNQAQS